MRPTRAYKGMAAYVALPTLSKVHVMYTISSLSSGSRVICVQPLSVPHKFKDLC